MNDLDYKNYVFNFSSSFSGGGLKRLMAYISWFHVRGGAHFIVNHRLDGYLNEFDNNIYYYVEVSPLAKFLNMQVYVKKIIANIGRCDFYFSYNIPMKNFDAHSRWFHLSNVLPLYGTRRLNIPIRRRVELWWLGIISKHGLKFCNFASAESSFSLDFFPGDFQLKKMISTNGADKELEVMSARNKDIDSDVAVVVGTYFHKNIDESYKVYQYLKSYHNNLKLLIIGDQSTIPENVKKDPSVILKGVIDHDETLQILSTARFFICTSLVENSWNAALEGTILSQESILSKIPPHIEFLEGSDFEELVLEDLTIPLVVITRNKIKLDKLRNWDEIIADMLEQIR